MAKFCTKCGKELVEGKCNCTSEKTVSSGKTVSSEKVDFMGLLKQSIEIVKGIFIAPIDTIEENTNENKFNLSIVLIVAYGLAMGLFTLVLVKELSGIIMGLFFSGFSSLLTSNAIEIPYVKIFILAFISAVVMLTVMALVVYVISNKFLKNNTNFKKVFVMFGVSSSVATVTLLASTVLVFVSYKIALIVLVAGSLLNSYYNFKGLEFATDTDKNKLGYVFMTSVLVSTFVVSFLSKLM